MLDKIKGTLIMNGIDHLQDYIKNHFEEVQDSTVQAIAEAIEKNEDDAVTLEYRLEPDNGPIQIGSMTTERSDFKRGLEEAINFYIESEQYEKCAYAESLIKKL